MTNSISKEKNGHVCPHQMAFMLDNWLRKIIQRPKKIVGEYIKEGDIVVDIGCGPGFFTIDMAKLVGPSGGVVAVDMQPQMLDRVRKKAARHKVSERLTFHQCPQHNVGLELKADFILCYYMVHETPDPDKFLAEISGLLKPDGKILVVEPNFHVSKDEFTQIAEKAKSAGLVPVAYPKGKGGRSVVLAHE